MTRDQRTGWLAELRRGDRVGLTRQAAAYDRITVEILTVTGVTPTGRLRCVSEDSRRTTEYRPDGKEPGHSLCYLIPASDADALIARARAQSALREAAGDVSLAAVVSMGTGGIGTEAAERLTAQAVALAAAIRAAARDKTPPSAAGSGR